MTVHSPSKLLQKPLMSNECSSRLHFLTEAPEPHKTNKSTCFPLVNLPGRAVSIMRPTWAEGSYLPPHYKKVFNILSLINPKRSCSFTLQMMETFSPPGEMMSRYMSNTKSRLPFCDQGMGTEHTLWLEWAWVQFAELISNPYHLFKQLFPALPFALKVSWLGWFIMWTPYNSVLSWLNTMMEPIWIFINQL